ncbi:MAG: acetylornithine transaminase [Candidatus Methanomethylophilaceae archaeon]|nr:acetylornithine transaminase [Candidatus Methanomethylophilaceae archaeon]
MKFEEVKELSSKYLFQNYGRIDLAFTHGKGCYLYDAEGKEYLDLVSGIAVNALGYAHPGWVEAVQDQVAKMVHVSNLYYVEEQARLAEKIASITPGDLDRTLFVNSGAEANEGALKLAVRYTGRKKVMSALNGFHGRTAAALGATGQKKYQDTFEALISQAFEYYGFGDPESVKGMISKDVAAVIVEPIQAEGGVRTAQKEFFKTIRDECDDKGALMIVDEVQTGIGRTGQWYGIQNYGVVPDIITMAKALGGGAPIGAVTSTEEISKVMTPGSHGTTFGGNPLVTASGCAVIDIMKKDKLVENSRDLGARWMKDLKAIQSPKVKEVRGLGLIIGIEMESNEAATAVQKHCRDNGVLVNVCHGNTVRLIPPLILNDGQKDRFTALLKECLRNHFRPSGGGPKQIRIRLHCPF